MKFTKRTTKPEKGNKYYNTKDKGGYSTAIKGSPTDPDCNVLHNCFSGDTRIVTRDGVFPFESLEGKTVEVLSLDATYRLADIKSYGEQELFKVTLENGDVFYATANHRWYVRRISFFKGKRYEKYVFKDTEHLSKSDYIPYNINQACDVDEDGIRHGFIYGDGSYYNGKRHSQANLCGGKRDFMMEYFIEAKHVTEQENGTISCYPYPASYKQIPDLSSTLEYLRGFIAGLMASDGCVDADGCPKISTVKKADAEKISEILSVLGYRNHVTSETRDTNYKKGSTIYNILIKKGQIPYQLFVNPKHQLRSIPADGVTPTAFTRVRSVESTGIIEDVYCAEEPETHTITLEGNILTGQCVGYAFGRVNEIAGDTKMSILEPRNAETWVAIAEKQGHKVYQSPKPGDVMCWAKGSATNSADGAGHVAVVEEVYSDQCVLTSESGWQAKNPFWTQVRNKGNGNWGQNSTYKFLGFIRPKQFEEADKIQNPYKVPTKVVKEGDSGEAVKWLQHALKQRGYLSSNVDGYFGVFTLGALLAYQFKNGLDVDGVCGPKTRASLS